jgi:ATP-binding cassette, subfamily B, bacterial PglK
MIADLFPARERALLGGVLGMSLLAALFEVVGVASILPFMSLMMDPSALDRYPFLRSAAAFSGVVGQRETLLFFGVVTVVLIAAGNAAAALNVVVQERFAARTKARVSDALFSGYVCQPYAFHVRRDAPSLIKIVINDASQVMGSIVQPALVAASRLVLTLSILGLLLLKDPLVTIAVIVVLGVAYTAVFRSIRKWQRRKGVEANERNLERQRIAQETFGGVKELQALVREGHAITQFRAATRGAAQAESTNRIMALLPRYLMESCAFGGILLTILVVETGNRSGGAQTLVPILALYAFAGYRLLPALQQMFQSAVVIRFNLPVLRGLHRDVLAVTGPNRTATAVLTERPSSVTFKNAVRLEKVAFSHDGAVTPALRGIDLTIRRNESVGLVGRTGAGKTTLADLLLGLYEPSSGRLTVDGITLTGPMIRAWRRHVGYVPQHVFLANASVAQNIALGLPPEQIDHDAVRSAAHLAQADEFILSLPHGFETVVGERGVRLSGGQRQRLGIARALYHDPQMLVFDEATSALDGLTEDAVMQAIRSLQGNRTVILIAHRMRTVEACDRIVMLQAGCVAADGDYDELLASSAEFRRLVDRAQLSNLELAG